MHQKHNDFASRFFIAKYYILQCKKNRKYTVNIVYIFRCSQVWTQTCELNNSQLSRRIYFINIVNCSDFVKAYKLITFYNLNSKFTMVLLEENLVNCVKSDMTRVRVLQTDCHVY